MKNLYASLAVLALLTACGAYTYQNTHAKQTLMPAYPADHWNEYVQHGGAFRGRP